MKDNAPMLEKELYAREFRDYVVESLEDGTLLDFIDIDVFDDRYRLSIELTGSKEIPVKYFGKHRAK